MKQIQANRLVSVLNMLETLPKEATFNISHWANDAGRRTEPTLKKALDCGTSACAVGWAILLIPAWRKQFSFKGIGLSLNEGTHIEMELSTTFSAIGEFTGITTTQSEYLFAPYKYPVIHANVTPSMVVTRIKGILADNGYDLY